MCAGLLMVYVLATLVSMAHNWRLAWGDLMLAYVDHTRGVSVTSAYMEAGWNNPGFAATVVGAVAILMAAAALCRTLSTSEP